MKRFLHNNWPFRGTLPLILSMTIVCSGFSLLFWQHRNYIHFEHQLDLQIENETGRMAIGALNFSDLNGVKALYYQLIIPMDVDRMQLLQEEAIFMVAEIHDALNVLEKGGVIMRRLPVNVAANRDIMFPIAYFPQQKTEYNLAVLELRPQLIELEANIKQLPGMVARRNQLLLEKNLVDLPAEVHHMIHFLQETEPLFERMTENANTLAHFSRLNLRALQKDSKIRRRLHLREINIIAATGLVLVLLLMAVIYRQIIANRRLLEEQVKYRTRELQTANTELEHQIQQRTEADRRILQEKERWEQTFDAIPDIITLQDDNFTILQSNQAGHQFFGEPTQLIGKKCHTLFHGIDTPCPDCPNLKITSNGRSHEEDIRHEFLHKWFHVTSSPVLAPDRKIQYIVHVARDISEQKLLEKNFLQAQKMESVGRLAGGVAHDFNNILSAINGYAELILLKMPKDSPFREEITIILESGKRASRLTKQLLAFSRKQITHKELLNINSEIKESQKMLGRLLGEHIEIAFFPAPDLGLIKADRSQMEQVLLNLAINSRDAMPQGGKLTIETARVLLDEEFSHLHNNLAPGDYIVLSVSDTGEGIAENVQEHIFEPFFTTKEQEKGTGLGLATIHGIIQQHNGYISVYSEPGQGTTFKIYLPRAWETKEERIKKPPLINEFQPEGNTILVVEDDEVVRTLVQRCLEDYGYRILTATDGTDGLHCFRQHREEIDLLLSDMIMPNMGGAELAEAILRETPDMKVIFMSGYTENFFLRQRALQGDINFIHKPIAVNELIKRIHFVLAVNRTTPSEQA